MKLNKLVKKSTQAEQKSKKQKPNSTFVDFDMLYLLSYMSVIAGADVPRDRVFEYTSRISCAPARYLHRIELAHTQLGHDYATACRVVGESAKEKGMKQFLLRFTSSLISGESEATFLAGEAEAHTRAYENDYVRKMGVLKQWTDAYISLILAGVLVVIVGIVSTMIWTIGTAFILGLVAISVGTSTLGVWTMSVMVPRELVTLASPGSREQKLTRILLVVLVPLAVGVSALLFLLGAGSGWVMLAGGVLILPIGLVSNLDHTKITSRDTEVGAFLRSLGGVCTALGTTVKDGLGQLDLGAVNVLRPGVKRLHTRLLAGIRPGLCWQRFISETGSELSNRSVGMFYDAVDLGGDPEQAGYHSSLFATKIASLRAERRSVASAFGWLSITMHATVVGLLIFISEVIGVFGKMVTGAQEGMTDIAGGSSMSSFATFNLGGLDLMQSMVAPLILVFTVANALGPSIVEGGSKLKSLRNLGLTAAISGAALIVLPRIAGALFASLEV